LGHQRGDLKNLGYEDMVHTQRCEFPTHE